MIERTNPEKNYNSIICMYYILNVIILNVQYVTNLFLVNQYQFVLLKANLRMYVISMRGNTSYSPLVIRIIRICLIKFITGEQTNFQLWHTTGMAS